MARTFRYTRAREVTHFVWTSAYSFSSVCRRLEYTRDQLLEFKKQMDEKVGQGQGEEQGGGFGGFGGFGGGSSEVSFDPSGVAPASMFLKGYVFVRGGRKVAVAIG